MSFFGKEIYGRFLKMLDCIFLAVQLIILVGIVSVAMLSWVDGEWKSPSSCSAGKLILLPFVFLTGAVMNLDSFCCTVNFLV
mmetsp:Transcript_2300/g.6645  ORF Transcript_2300/g.6645 Transcript_2300/m.6645 type:complete len:82 (-) Transcript_2300:176-421(-)